MTPGRNIKAERMAAELFMLGINEMGRKAAEAMRKSGSKFNGLRVMALEKIKRGKDDTTNTR